MKKQYILYMMIALLWPVSNATAEDKSIVVQQNADAGIIILFCLLVFILAILAYWLLKSSNKLRFMDQVEPDGADWVNKHLNDLEIHQLDKLINRRHRVNNEVNSLKINKKTML